MKKPFLSAERIGYRYPGTAAAVFQDFSFNMIQGECVCLLGPSGCGKTTLLNLAAGFLIPEAGRIQCRGETVRGPDKKRIMVFQGYDQLFPWKTVLGNVLFPMKPADRKRAGEILSLADISGTENLYPVQLSGGMKQRVALARALACSPEMLFLDEPFDGLDPPTRRGLQETLWKIRGSLGISMLLVTHDIQEALILADRIILMTPDGRSGQEHQLKEKEFRNVNEHKWRQKAEEIYRELESLRIL